MQSEDFARFIYLAVLLAAIAGWMIVEYRQRMGQALRVALAWGLIIIGLMAGYGMWNDIRGSVAMDATVQGDRITIPRAADGHYYLRLGVNESSVQFMIDTGASGIVLAHKDAEALGIDMADLRYLGQAFTANGVVRTARVNLDQITLGPYADRNLSAYVTEGEMEGSLLGMDYLGLFAIQIAEDQMILSR